MRATRVLETVLYGRDIDAMRAFYEAVIGLEVDSELPGKFVFFKMADQMLLIFNPELSSIQKTEDGPPPHGPIGPGHMCLRSAEGDLARWQAHLEAHGVAIEKLMDWPDGGRSVYFRDPAGNSLEFSEGVMWGFKPMRSLANQKIVIATHNKGKLEEFSALIKPYGVEAVSAGALGLPEPVETENTFAGNARIKALAAMQASGLIAVSDDSGLCVEALGGEPGVYTAPCGWWRKRSPPRAPPRRTNGTPISPVRCASSGRTARSASTRAAHMARSPGRRVGHSATVTTRCSFHKVRRAPSRNSHLTKRI